MLRWAQSQLDAYPKELGAFVPAMDACMVQVLGEMQDKEYSLEDFVEVCSSHFCLFFICYFHFYFYFAANGDDDDSCVFIIVIICYYVLLLLCFWFDFIICLLQT